MKLNFETQRVFFSSDFHFGHSNVIKFDNRPFVDSDEMDETLINNWNSIVKKDDIAFFLGDFSFKGSQFTKDKADRLNGIIYFVLGNHDKYNAIKKLNRFADVRDYYQIGIRDEDSISTRGSKGYQKIILSHYPMMSWDKMHHGVWHLHGHTHGNLLKNNLEFRDFYYTHKVMDVGCNCIGYEPISYVEIKNIFKDRI